MKILVLNGPNLNLLGTREPAIYGTASLDDLETQLRKRFPQIDFTFRQSNHEGVLIDLIQSSCDDGIVLNAGAYTHTSLAIADAIAAVKVPVVEVHISNIFAREDIRRNSLIAPVCHGSVSGFGLRSYELAVMSFI